VGVSFLVIFLEYVCFPAVFMDTGPFPRLQKSTMYSLFPEISVHSLYYMCVESQGERVVSS